MSCRVVLILMFLTFFNGCQPSPLISSGEICKKEYIPAYTEYKYVPENVDDKIVIKKKEIRYPERWLLKIKRFNPSNGWEHETLEVSPDLFAKSRIGDKMRLNYDLVETKKGD